MIETLEPYSFGLGIGSTIMLFIILYVFIKLLKRKKKHDLSNIRLMISEANKEMNNANNKLIELNKAFEELENA